MRFLIVALLSLASIRANASPYLQLLDPHHPNVAAGSLFDTHGGTVQGFTNVAIVYHPLTAGSIIPLGWQTYIPPESWTLLNLGFGGGAGNYVAGPGSSVNLLAAPQSWLYLGLSKTSLGASPFVASMKPGASAFSIQAGPQWTANVIRNNTIEPLNKWNFIPRWFVALAYGF